MLKFGEQNWTRRKKERLWRRLRTDEARKSYKEARNKENRLIVQRKREYYKDKVIEVGSNMNKLYKILDNLTGNKRERKLPEGIPDCKLADDFLDYFYNKTKNIVDSLNNSDIMDEPNFENQVVKLVNFNETDIATVKSIVKRVKVTHCDNDPIPVRELMKNDKVDGLIEIYVDIINCSIANKIFPRSEKEAIVKPIVKGKLDTQCLSSFRPVSNLTFLSKIIENVILDRLIDHMNTV